MIIDCIMDGGFGLAMDRCWAVRPVLYLVPGITIKDGAGTESSPYRINGIIY